MVLGKNTTSLSYQIANAEKCGYSEERICAAVVWAVSPSSNLRTYLESKPDLNLNTLTEILREIVPLFSRNWVMRYKKGAKILWIL